MEKASKSFISDLKKQKRENKSLLFLDNAKIIKDAIKNKTIKVDSILTSLEETEFVKLNFNLQNSSVNCKDKQTIAIYRVDEKTIEQLSDTKTPQKVLCIAYYIQNIVSAPNDNFLVLDGLQDPGNVGTLIRTAKACGFESVFLIDSVKITNSKLIRSSVGAVFNENVFEMSRIDFVKFAKKYNLQLVKCDMNGENIFNFKPKTFVGVVIGNEGQGVSKEISDISSYTVKIPMKEGIESLNAGVSGAIIMYEINKKVFN